MKKIILFQIVLLTLFSLFATNKNAFAATTCTIQGASDYNFSSDKRFHLTITNFSPSDPNKEHYFILKRQTSGSNTQDVGNGCFDEKTLNKGVFINPNSSNQAMTVDPGNYIFDIYESCNRILGSNLIATNQSGNLACEATIEVKGAGQTGTINSRDSSQASNVVPIPTEPPQPSPPCKDLDTQTFKCKTVETGIGDINTDTTGFVKSIFTLLLSLAGIVALGLIIYSGVQILTSQGNPERVQGARETITSAIVGLLFIIFSLVILQVIGIDILKIPGFH